ncbi:MAG: hypothetical protein A2571_00725 [Candidatus Vogelbacteria bacterium RIFOXYD1_FULL_44_32]|uniref:Dipeptidylpeptidase IV N-terminal domain-containing protein n=1 Tax=Candidatus Vogelbacteria bacterium RIFOXYD1_FULL_44_32 TaxID=1802438 RepID=A0A1G2QFZ7_9BACT|nr:MAG: hypothetical protein A2571_00725 [Candidatus Vogelbacteria bacterium RIFOXYD1_FULL_44_32]
MLKKIFSLIIILLVIVLGWYGFVWYQNQKQLAPTGQTASSTTNGFFPTIGIVAQNIADSITGTIDNATSSNTQPPDQEIRGLLREIISTPSPGFILNEDGVKPSIIYVDNQTGNLFALDLTDLKQKPTKISSMTITDIFHLTGVVKNNSLLAVLDTINKADERKKYTIFKRDIAGPTLTETGELVGGGRAVVAKKDQAIYYTENMSDLTLVYKDVLGSKSLVGNLPLSDWNLHISGNKLITSTYPDPSAKGFAYAFDLDSTKKEKVVVDRQNLSLKVSPDYKKIIYSTGDQTTNSLHLLNKSEKTSQTLITNTFADKCLWSADAETIYCAVPNKKPVGGDLNLWQRGEISFSDYFVAISANTGRVTKINNPAESGQAVDVINLNYSKTLNSLVFTNKTDLHTYILGL